MDFEDDDLDEIYDHVESHRGRPHLVEVLRRHDGRRTAFYCWSSGRIVATISGDVARVQRRLGNVGDSYWRAVPLRLDDLRAVLRACRFWVEDRDAWAAFYSVSAGFGGGGSDLYQPPGKRDVKVVGQVMMGRRRGGELVGEDVVRQLARPLRIARGILATAELWRAGEAYGPKSGSLAGLRLDLGNGLVFEARRNEARIAPRRAGEVFIEEDEAPFVRALVGVLARRGAARPA